MDKNFYIEQIDNYKQQIEDAQTDMALLKEIYISENKPASIGQEVILEDKPAIVRALYVDYKNEVKVKLVSRKKLDGDWAKATITAIGTMTDLEGNIIQVV